MFLMRLRWNAQPVSRTIPAPHSPGDVGIGCPTVFMRAAESDKKKAAQQLRGLSIASFRERSVTGQRDYDRLR